MYKNNLGILNQLKYDSMIFCLDIFSPLGFTIPWRNLSESNKFYQRKYTCNKDKQREEFFFEIDLICH
jgi:hypothetical protein